MMTFQHLNNMIHWK